MYLFLKIACVRNCLGWWWYWWRRRRRRRRCCPVWWSRSYRKSRCLLVLNFIVVVVIAVLIWTVSFALLYFTITIIVILSNDVSLQCRTLVLSLSLLIDNLFQPARPPPAVILVSKSEPLWFDQSILALAVRTYLPASLMTKSAMQRTRNVIRNLVLVMVLLMVSFFKTVTELLI